VNKALVQNGESIQGKGEIERGGKRRKTKFNKSKRREKWRYKLHNDKSILSYDDVFNHECRIRSAGWQRSIGSYVKQLMMNCAARSASAGSKNTSSSAANDRLG